MRGDAHAYSEGIMSQFDDILKISEFSKIRKVFSEFCFLTVKGWRGSGIFLNILGGREPQLLILIDYAKN